MLTSLTTWKTGRRLVHERLRSRVPLDRFVSDLGSGKAAKIVRVDGTAVFLYSEPGFAPPAMLTFVRASGALHRDVLVVSIVTANTPTVPRPRRLEVTDLGSGIRRVVLHYGFMEELRIADELAAHLAIDPAHTDYFLGREVVRSTARPGMARWRERLFTLMERNATDMATYFHLPDDRVVEIGQRLEL